jgi:hypothetical protein
MLRPHRSDSRRARTMLRHAADRIMISVSPFVARTITNDAATSKTLDNHSHVVRPAEMEWKKTRFPGREVKGLLLDQQTGLVTDAGDVPSAQQILRGRRPRHRHIGCRLGQHLGPRVRGLVALPRQRACCEGSNSARSPHGKPHLMPARGTLVHANIRVASFWK